MRTILKGKDCTDTISSIKQLSSGKYAVTFKGSGKNFFYAPSNVLFLEKQQTLDTGKYLVLIDGEAQNGITRIDDYGEYYHLTYKTGFERSVPAYSIQLVESCLDVPASKERFDYYKSIAYEVSLYTDQGKNILGSYYEKVGFIRDDTVLADYLTGEITDNSSGHSSSQHIFPFGFNASQRQATNNALDNKLSVIQGPPGTGKTQTILNLIANIVREGKTVAVVSNNNSATDNVHEKLQAEGLDFIAARLGSVKNKQNFVLNQYVPPKEKLETWRLPYYERQELDDELHNLAQYIDHILDEKNRLASLKAELDSVLTEYAHFEEYCRGQSTQANEIKLRKQVKSQRLLDLWRKIEQTNGELSFIDRLWLFFFSPIRAPKRFYDQPSDNIITTTQDLYYKAKIKELQTSIKLIEMHLAQNDVNEKISRHADISMRLFRSQVAERYIKKPQKSDYSLDDLWKNSKEFIEDYPVVLSTTYSLRSSLSNNYVYDYVIVDEASQVDLATFVLALSCAKRAVVVGDQKQLPNVITNEVREKDAKIFSQYSMPEAYQLSSHSALSAVTELFGDKVPSQLLREHYRCHPKIIQFCNQMFYDNQLIVLTPNSDERVDPLKVYETEKGNHARDEHINQRQIDVTLHEVVPQERLDLTNDSVGIVTPYRNHAKALNSALVGKAVLAATVDKFQGRERDVIILNTVDNKISEFASNPNRLNVAVSRAKKQLIVVTNGNENSSHTGIDELIDYIKYNNLKIIKSKVRSIFDNLYTNYHSRRAKKARNGSSVAEDFMLELLHEIIDENNLTNLDIQLEYPLRMLIDTSGLVGRELEYANHCWTKVDFVIFRKTSKQPVLAIEVDGYTFHMNEKQQERDAIKNRLLSKAGLPLVRLSTTGSNEKTIILTKLRELMNQ